MNEKRKEDRGGQPDDLIEQIITQGLEQIKPPLPEAEPSDPGPEEGAEAASPASERKGGGEDAPPANRKNGGPAVWFYLTILFGAAFLITLLACFAQRRGSETAVSDLRDSMNLSQEELLAQISALEDRNTALEDQNAALREQSESQRREISERIYSFNALVVEHNAAQEGLYSWDFFWELERYYQAGDYERCAALLMISKDLNPYEYRTPDSARERYEEIVQTLIDAGVIYSDMPV